MIDRPARRRSARLLLPFLTGLVTWLLPLLSPLAADTPAPAAPAVAESATPVVAAKKAWVLPKPGMVEVQVAREVVNLMTRGHYERKPLSPAMQAKWYDAYFEQLDHDRSYFLATDLEDFRDSREALAQQLYDGDLRFAYNVYARFMLRVQERLEYVQAAVKKPMDFTVDEEIVLDHSKEPWCPDREAQDEYWRKRVKNQLLTYTLHQDELKEKEAKKLQDAKDKPAAEAAVPPSTDGMQEKKDKPAVPPPPQKTPAERVVLFYESYLDGFKENDSMGILERFLCAYTQLFDPHSSYMAPESVEDFNIQMSLSLQGIGAVLTTEDGYVKIVEVVPGGPAGLDGRLQEGDRITAVAQDGKEPVNVINMPLSKVVHQIRGAKGTRVFLSVLPADKGLGGMTVTIDIVRNEVKLTEQEAKSEFRPLFSSVTPAPAPVNTGVKPAPAAPASVATPAASPAPATAPVAAAIPVGPEAQIINLPSFYADFGGRRNGNNDYKSASRDIRKLLEAAQSHNVGGLILDLRYDGGGSLDEAIAIAGLFLGKAPVVQVRDARRQVKISTSQEDDFVYRGPMIVLVNRFSASASEIVAAALQDHHRAVILGDATTHGKGTVQTVFDLEKVMKNASFLNGRSPGSLKFTMAKFYRVNGGSTQQRGVIPDIIFPAYADHMEVGESSLPSCMTYDEIVPLTITGNTDVRPLLDTLRPASAKRLAADSDFQAMVKSIDHYGDIRKLKTVSLNKVKRQELQKTEEEFSRQFRESTAARKKSKKKVGAEDDDSKPTRDLVLDEAVRVLADMAQSQGITPAAPTTKPVPAVDVK